MNHPPQLDESPDYGTLAWDGQDWWLSLTVRFDKDTKDEWVVRARATSWLRRIREDELPLIELEICKREGLPVKAMLKAKLGVLSGERLKELSRV